MTTTTPIWTSLTGLLPPVDSPWEAEGENGRKERWFICFTARSEALSHMVYNAVTCCVMKFLRMRGDKVDMRAVAATHFLNIADKRKKASSFAIQKQADVLMFIDDDMLPDDSALVDLYDYMHAHPEVRPGVFGRAYVSKSDECSRVMAKFDNVREIVEVPKEPLEVHFLGTGFMAIDVPVLSTLRNRGFVPFVGTSDEDGDLMETEDYYFTGMAALNGFHIIMLPPVMPHVKFYSIYPPTEGFELGEPQVQARVMIKGGKATAIGRITTPELVFNLPLADVEGQKMILDELQRRGVRL